MRQWLRNQKFKLMCKWAQQFGLYVVAIRNVGGTEYLVDNDGAWRKLATKVKKKAVA